MKTHAERKASRDGYFAPESVIRLVVNSPLIPLLGAGPAVLFQVAHPLVAASIADQPDFRRTLWPRWLQIIRALYLIIYGSKEEADQVGEATRSAHSRVEGTTDVALGPFPAGTSYSASDPALMLWVHAALVEVALAVYGRFVWPLTRADERRFYREMTVVAEIVGVPPSVVPATLGEFREYLRTKLAGPEICVTQPARQIAAAVLNAPLPIPVRPLRPAHRLATAGLLPPSLRSQYGLPWDPGRTAAMHVAAWSLRLAAAPLVFAAERIVASPH